MKKVQKQILSIALSAVMAVSIGMPSLFGGAVTAKAADEAQAGEFDSQLKFGTDQTWTKQTAADGTEYYAMKNIVFCGNVVSEQYQYMNIYAPAAYIKEDGKTLDPNMLVNGYSSRTAPIILQNNCSGWMSSNPEQNSRLMTDYLKKGFVYVVSGARSRGAMGADNKPVGKSPAPVVDLKSAVRDLRLNGELVPGNEDRIISVGTSGGGQMSSILGASGNMDEYYSYLYDSKAAGIVKSADGSYTSTIDDNVYAAQCFCPIADIANADLAYAWMRYDEGATSVNAMFGGLINFTKFQMDLQEDEAEAYVDYLNSLGIQNEDGTVLSLDGTRNGSYYDQVLQNVSNALNAFAKKQTFPYTVSKGMGPNATQVTYNSLDDYLAQYTDTEKWLEKDESGNYKVTDFAEFFKGTALARNKDIPGFDTMSLNAENNAFGSAEQEAVHFSKSVADIFQANAAEYEAKQAADETYGYSKEVAEAYIADTTEDVQQQTYLMNATQIMLNKAKGTEEAAPAQYWRTRNGTADEHTSFSIAYNLAMAARMAGCNVDYSLVWGMPHTGEEGEGITTGTFAGWVESIVPKELDAEIYLDYANGIKAGVYAWFDSGKGYHYLASCDEDGNVVSETNKSPMGEQVKVLGTYTSAKITNAFYQTMVICVPDAYLNEDGTVNKAAAVKRYTAETAPVVFENNNAGWQSGTPKIEGAKAYTDEGMIYVSAGSRSRDAMDAYDRNHTGKAPTPVVDLKAGVIELRKNAAVIPGNMEHIFSVGTSGAGQMSTILGASGNMTEYYPYMYETGVAGVSKTEEGNYASEYKDSVFAAQAYCPIADIENADLAYAWMHYDDGQASVKPMFGPEVTFTEFQLQLQNDEAQAFCAYINGLGLKDKAGKPLTFDKNTDGTWNPRSGSYYDAVLQNISDALNAFLKNTKFPCTVSKGMGPNATKVTYNSLEDYLNQYTNQDAWLKKEANGDYKVTDMAGFIKGTNLARNKDIPGFDTLANDAENDAFGYAADYGVHYSKAVAQILQENYAKYEKLAGFAEQKVNVDQYIADAITNTGKAEDIEYQTNLMNATEILLGNNGLTAVNPAQYWRTRNGTADEHTSFTIAYNVALSTLSDTAEGTGVKDVDYSLVWAMGHGSEEGTTTGTFINWIKSLTLTAPDDIQGTLDELENQLNNTQKELDAANAESKEAQKSLDEAKKKLDEAKEQAAKDAGEAQKKLEEAAKKLKEAQEQAAELQKTVNGQGAKVSLSKTSFTYNGRVQKPSVTVKDSSGKTIAASNYTLSFSNGSKNAGTYKATVKFDGKTYKGSLTSSYKIVQAKQTIKVKKSSYTYQSTVLKNAQKKFSLGASAKGKLTYKVKSTPKGAKKHIKVTSKGKVTLVNGAKKGTYKITVKAAKTKNYKAAQRTITIRVK